MATHAHLIEYFNAQPELSPVVQDLLAQLVSTAAWAYMADPGLAADLGRILDAIALEIDS